jgi:hypothetical protein
MIETRDEYTKIQKKRIYPQFNFEKSVYFRCLAMSDFLALICY